MPPAPPIADNGLAPILRTVLLLTFIFLLNFISRIIFAPLLPAIEVDLGLNHAQAGALFLFISAGYFTSVLSSGFLAARIGHRATVIASAVGVGAIMILTGLSDSLWGARAGLFLLGVAAGVYLPSGMATLTDLTPARLWGRTIAIHELAPNLAFLVSPLIAEALMALFGWRAVVMVVGSVSVATGASFALWGRGGAFRGQKPDLAHMSAMLGNIKMWRMSGLFSLGVGASVGVFAMLPLFLIVDLGWERAEANMLVAASRISGVFMAFVAGWATDRLGPRRALAASLACTGAVTVGLGLLPGHWVVAMVFLQPAVSVTFFPPAFAAISGMVAPAERNMAVALAAALGITAGAGLFPAGLSLIGQYANFGLGFMVAGALVLAGLSLLPARNP